LQQGVGIFPARSDGYNIKVLSLSPHTRRALSSFPAVAMPKATRHQ